MGIAGTRRCRRRGLSSLEIVMTTAISLPLAVTILLLCSKIAKLFYHTITILVGWPFL